ncbi:hypothetical protein FB451DRAFT_1405042 [Mycena latifolia]|nr:hypothetical protein FB451DRAFT_1405042 [Mycena latifolia]
MRGLDFTGTRPAARHSPLDCYWSAVPPPIRRILAVLFVSSTVLAALITGPDGVANAMVMLERTHRHIRAKRNPNESLHREGAPTSTVSVLSLPQHSTPSPG